MDYVNKLENLAKEKQAFKQNVRKHKLAQLGLMENVGLYTQPILAEQEKTREAIEALGNSNNKQLETSEIPRKQIEFSKHIPH